jgi:hypothetical protein
MMRTSKYRLQNPGYHKNHPHSTEANLAVEPYFLTKHLDSSAAKKVRIRDYSW